MPHLRTYLKAHPDAVLVRAPSGGEGLHMVLAPYRARRAVDDELVRAHRARALEVIRLPDSMAGRGLAVWMITFNRCPSVSTKIWRLRPLTFLPAS